MLRISPELLQSIATPIYYALSTKIVQGAYTARATVGDGGTETMRMLTHSIGNRFCNFDYM